jgi:hypothetical protein
MNKFQITQRTLIIFQIVALFIFLLTILYVPTFVCESYKGLPEECHDAGWQLFTELNIDKDEEWNIVTSLKLDVYIIQIILTFVSLFGIYRILKSLSK